MESVFDVLKQRGYLAQISHEDEIREYMNQPGAYFYVGYDPTADSLHVGHLVQLMIMSHLQRAGLRPIALLGGGTGMVGDPSGRTDLRKVLTPEDIQHNIDCFRFQMRNLVDFSEGQGIMVNNADWLLSLNYVEFLREIGSLFSVNRMLSAECYKNRLEKGLTFLEFNYMLMQAYDFLVLFRRFGCRLQLGGDDQWSNVLAGADLIRRKEQESAFCITSQLLTTSEGIKMGKTSKGALWLDENKCSVFDFFQYWRNIDDRDVGRCLRMLTFLPLDEINRLEQLEGSEINQAKTRLAFEVTQIVHGREKAEEAAKQAREIFEGSGSSENMPGAEVKASDLERTLLDLLCEHGFLPSRSEGRRLLEQGGLSLNEQAVQDPKALLTLADFPNGKAIIRKGKKKFFAFTLIE